MVIVDGRVAIKYYHVTRKWVDLPYKPNQPVIFVIKNNIAMAWVDVGRDADYILALRGGCCGQKKAGVYTYATEADVLRHV